MVLVARAAHRGNDRSDAHLKVQKRFDKNEGNGSRRGRTDGGTIRHCSLMMKIGDDDKDLITKDLFNLN